MFDNLTKEIIYFSLIPFAIFAILTIILLLIGKKKHHNYFKYNYFIKVFLFIMLGLVLPLIIGYTIWIYERFNNKGILMSNILYMILLVVLVISLLILLTINIKKAYKLVEQNQELPENKEFQ